jgi:hypothetical protein
MTLFLESDQLEFLGQSWSLWPPQGLRGFNFVQNLDKIASDIMTVCLTRKGDRPLYPDYGIAPDLFDPLSTYPVEYWLYHIQEEIIKWVEGIDVDLLRINVHPIVDSDNELATDIFFAPIIAPDQHILTFGFYSYQGAIWQNQSVENFLQDVSLDDRPFNGLT